MEPKTYSENDNYIKENNPAQCGTGVDLLKYKNKVLQEFKEKEIFGGFEGKIENGKIVFFKHWVSKKI